MITYSNENKFVVTTSDKNRIPMDISFIISLIIGIIIAMIILFFLGFYGSPSPSNGIKCLRSPGTKPQNKPPYSNDNVLDVIRATDIGPASTASDLVKPLPTGWWSSSYLAGDVSLSVYPWMVRVMDDGISMDYGQQSVSNGSVEVADDPGRMRLGTLDLIPSSKITYIDEMTVYLSWASTEGGCKTMSAPLVRGSPYITMEYFKISPRISSDESYSWSFPNGIPNGQPVNEITIDVSRGGVTTRYNIYAQPAVSFTRGLPTELTSPPYSGYIRIAQVESAAHGSLLRTYRNQYPTSAVVDISTENLVNTRELVDMTREIAPPSRIISTVTFKWITVGGGGLLMLALPHHTITNETSIPGQSSLIFNPPLLSPSRSIIGNEWKMRYEAIGNGPSIDGVVEVPTYWNPYYNINLSAGFLPVIQDQWTETATTLSTSIPPRDEIGYTNWIQQISNLLTIGEQLGRRGSPLFNTCLDILKSGLELSRFLYAYDGTWGSVIYSPATSRVDPPRSQERKIRISEDRPHPKDKLQVWSSDQLPMYKMGKAPTPIISRESKISRESRDINGLYSDHNRMYGRICLGFATVGRYDQKWLSSRRNLALIFARDITNPSPHDTYFPRWRYKDWYHGWSTSSSPISEDPLFGTRVGEAVNAYYSVFLLGLTIGNSDMMGTATALLLTEISSSRIYLQPGQTPSFNLPSSFGTSGTITEWTESGYSFSPPITSLPPPFIGPTNSHLSQSWISYVVPSLSITPSEGDEYAYSLMLSSMLPDQAQIMWPLATQVEENSLTGLNKLDLLYWIGTQFVRQIRSQ